MFEAVSVPNWVVPIYEGQWRFNQQAVNQMITGFVRSCGEVGRTFKASSTNPTILKMLEGITINAQPALVRWESGQGIIGRVRYLVAYFVDS